MPSGHLLVVGSANSSAKPLRRAAAKRQRRGDETVRGRQPSAVVRDAIMAAEPIAQGAAGGAQTRSLAGLIGTAVGRWVGIGGLACN